MRDKIDKLPEKEVKHSRKDKIKELLAEIKGEFGIDVELSKNIRYRLEKVIDYLNDHYEFRYNIINTDTEYRRIGEKEYKYFDDRDYRDIFLEVKFANIPVSDQDFKAMVYGSKVSQSYNPFKEYFANLPKWDGKTDHIRKYLEQVQLKDENLRPYFVEGFKKWFVALVVSLIKDIPHPYYINQTCLVLVGKQGEYKTTFLQNIVPQNMKLKYFYGGTFQFHNKDHEKYLAYKIIINLDEMAALNKTDIESAKSRITQDQVIVRLPYAKADEHLKRRASFTATQNNTEFLRDDSGSRRWFVIHIDNITLEEIDVDSMYAQALVMYKNKYKYWFDREEIQAVEYRNQEFQLRNFEEEYLLKHYQIPDEFDFKINKVLYMSASDIADDLATKYQRINVNNTVIKNIGASLRKNGFYKRSVRQKNRKYPIPLWVVKKTEDLLFHVDDSHYEENLI